MSEVARIVKIGTNIPLHTVKIRVNSTIKEAKQLAIFFLNF